VAFLEARGGFEEGSLRDAEGGDGFGTRESPTGETQRSLGDWNRLVAPYSKIAHKCPFFNMTLQGPSSVRKFNPKTSIF
jgi:hypothetical protein